MVFDNRLIHYSLPNVTDEARVVVALGSYAWDGVLRGLGALGMEVAKPKPRFGHGAEAESG